MTIAQVAPRLAKAHRERLAEIRRRRPCGRDGYCTACYLDEEIKSGRVAWTRHESTPWFYRSTDPRYAPDWPYTLWQYHGGFRTRVYDWELEHPLRRWSR